MKVLILQRVVPSYRVSLFSKLTSNADHNILAIIGTDVSRSKAKNASNLTSIRYKQLPAVGLMLFGRLLTWHQGLLRTLFLERPDIIICEAESHFLAYWVAIFYRTLFSRNTKLVLWCFFALPGVERERSWIHGVLKACARGLFDHFLSYTSYGSEFLIGKGVQADRITVAVNVCDTEKYTYLDRTLEISKLAAKDFLGVKDYFVVSYFGTLDAVKRPEVLIDLADKLKLFDKKIYFFIIGGGVLEVELHRMLSDKSLSNVRITGRVTENIEIYYRATDLVLIPGRGGIVISEAMCFGVPVVVHQADGVERDLVVDHKSGFLIHSGESKDFADVVEFSFKNQEMVKEFGLYGKRLIHDKYNTEDMAKKIVGIVELMGSV